MHDPGRLGAGAVGVAEAHLAGRHDGVTELVEELRWAHRLGAPRRRVEDHRRGGELGVGAERLGECLDELAQRRLGFGRGGGCRTGDHEQRSCLVLGEPAEIGAGPAEELPAAVAPGLRVHGDPGDRQRLEVAPGRLHRHLQLLGELRCGDPSTRLEHQQRGDEAIGPHGYQSRAITGHLMAMLAGRSFARLRRHGSGRGHASSRAPRWRRGHDALVRLRPPE